MKKSIIITVILTCLFCTAIFASDMYIKYTALKSNAQIYVDGKKTDFDLPVVTIDDFTYVPLREAAEKSGMSVEWSQKDNTINLLSEDKPFVVVDFYPSAYKREEVSPDDFCYVLKLYNDGRYQALYSGGERSEELNVQSWTTTEIKMSEEKTKKLQLLAKSVGDKPNEIEGYWLDCWTLSIDVNGRHCEFLYDKYNVSVSGSKEMSELVKEIVSLCPIELDMPGDA